MRLDRSTKIGLVEVVHLLFVEKIKTQDLFSFVAVHGLNHGIDELNAHV